MLRAPAGLGKTTQVVGEIAKRGGHVEIYVPTHALAEAQAKNARLKNPNLKVKVIAGRSHLGGDGKPLCKKNKMAEEIARAGGEVYSSLCARKKGSAEERCQHYATCPYIDQFARTDMTFYTHAHLSLMRSRLEPQVPDIAVIDESFFGSCIGKLEIHLSVLHGGILGPVSSHVCAEIARALTQNLHLYQHLYATGATPEVCVEALREVRQAASSMHPRMGLKKRRAVLQRLRKCTEVAELLHAICTEYFLARPTSQALKYCPDTQTITVHVKKAISRFHDYEGNEAQVLIIMLTRPRGSSASFSMSSSSARFKPNAKQRSFNVVQCVAPPRRSSQNSTATQPAGATQRSGANS